MTATKPTGVDVVVAAQTLGTTVRHTPLDLSLRLSGIRQQEVLLKREDQQVGRSYKVRGAYNFISSLNAEPATSLSTKALFNLTALDNAPTSSNISFICSKS